MAISLHSCGLLMLDVCSRAPQTHRRVAFFWSLFVLLPALASAQALTVTAMWDPMPPNAQVSSYEVCIGRSSLACDIKLVTVNVSQTSYTFAPPPGQLVYVAVRALNPTGRGSYSTEQSFSIPSLAPITNRNTAQNATITPINLAVADPDGSPLTFTHTGLPLGVTMNPNTGQISGAPTSAGTYNVTVFVSDGLKTVSSSFVWTVTAGAAADRTPPTLTVTSHASGLVVTTASQTIRGTATDNGKGGSGITAVRVNGQAASGGTASGNNTANWSRTISLSPGSNTITIDAVDGAGNINMQQVTLQLGVSGSSSNSSSSRGSSSGGTTTGGVTTSGSVSSSSSASTGPLRITSLTSNLASPQSARTSITYTVTASGGRAPYEFKWWLFDGTTWTIVRNWSTTSYLTWAPTQAGTYRIGVWVRNAGVTGDAPQVNAGVDFVIRASGGTSQVGGRTSGPLTVTSLTSSLNSPQTRGTAVTFTPGVTGGTAPYQYKYWLFDGTSWRMIRDWSTTAQLTWTPTRAGTYRIGVWVRNAGVTVDAAQANRGLDYIIR